MIKTKIYSIKRFLFDSNKKAMAAPGMVLWQNWAETLFILLLIVGLVLSITIQNAFLNYLIIFCAGLMAGRVIFIRKGKQPLFPFFLIIIGFLFGYMLGSFSFNRKVITFLFILGAIIGYYIHKKGYIH